MKKMSKEMEKIRETNGIFIRKSKIIKIKK